MIAEARGAGPSARTRSALGWACLTGAGLACATAIGMWAGPGDTMLGGGLVLAVALAGIAALLLASDASWGVGLALLATMLAVAAPGPGTLRWDRLAVAAAVVAFAAEVRRGSRRLTAPGALEGLMLALVLLQVASAIAPHELAAVNPQHGPNPGAAVSLVRMVETGILLPAVLFFLARRTFDRQSAMLRFLWILCALGVYAAAISILEGVGARSLVFPERILDLGLGAPAGGRARGIFLNAAVTGTALVLALAATLHLAAQPSVRARRLALPATAIILGGIYFGHERGPLIAALAVLVGAAAFGPRAARRWLVLLLAALAVAAAVNLDAIASSDRARGGIGSRNEIESRLNIEATGLWAVARKPLLGWGLGRYGVVNTDEHRACCGLPWERGYGFVAHDTHLGIAAELGLLGLALWLGVLAGLVAIARRAWRRLPASGVVSRELVVAFALAFGAYLVNATLIDMRFSPFPTAVVFAWAGALAALTARAQAESGTGRDSSPRRSRSPSASSAPT